MRRFLKTVIVVAMIAMMSDLATAQTFTYPVRGEKGFSLSEKTRDGLHVSYNLGQFTLSPLSYRGEDMSEISISGMVLPNTEGYPNLPVESRMLAVPQGANARLNVIHVESEIIRGVDIAPALRIQPENEEPEFNYVKDQNVYGRNAFYPEQPFTIDRSSIRGVDVVGVSVSPFQYNPVTKELKVYTNIELSVSFEGGNGHFGDDRLRSPYWDPILAAELMNYDQLPVIDYSARMQQWLRDGADGAEYLIITPNNDGWAEYANQLKDYRTRQGILTEVYRLDEMPASSISEMKAWFHNAYNTWTIPPVAVLLFGDHGTDMSQYIPAETVSHPYEGSCISDNGYADVTGDNLPEMVFSRLVAANVTEAQMMVSKQIEYEYTNPNMDASTYDHPITALGWQTERWFQICSEAVGGYWRNQGKHPVRINEIYGGTPGSIWSSNQNTDMVVSYFGPNGQGYIPATPSELGGWTGGTGDQVVSAVNSGSMLLQHRDHGNFQGWGEPTFNTSYVNQMNNVGKMTFVNTINCQTGAFDYSSNCLIEAFMRRTYNGQNAGAVGCLGPTQTSYSFVNDTYVWGLMDQYDPDFLPDYGPFANYQGNWQPAFGNVAGKYFLQQSSWPYNSGSKEITYKMFTAHCDAFLRLYTQVPKTMELTHSNVVVAGYGAITVTAPEGCMISLVKANPDGGWDILAVASATGSSQVVEFEPQVPPTIIHIVVTGQDYIRYEDTIEVVPAEGSYIVVDSYTPNYTPVNLLTPLSMTFKNVGLDATTGITTVTLSSQDDRLTVVDGTGQFGTLGSNQVITLENEFSFIIAQNVLDNTKFHLNVTMTCGADTWTGVVTITAAQAIPEYVGMTWAEMFDPGETLTVTAIFGNSGHYMATNAVAQIASTSQYVSFVNNTYEVGTLEATSQVECTFDVVIASNCPETEQIPITFTLNADGGLVAEGSEILKNIIITVEANPEEGGTVSGGGKYGPGLTCTITASANAGYVFNSWTLDGVSVSYFPTYSFAVSGDATYVANFQSVENGVVIGEGTGTNVYLPSYSFYCYTLSQQIYTAEEMNMGAGEISSVSFFNTGYTKTRNYTVYLVNTEKSAFENSYDWIAVTEADQVFNGSVTMTAGSWTTIYFGTPFSYDGSSNIALIVDDNTGSWSSNSMSCRVSTTESNQAIYVYSDGTNYAPAAPSGYSGSLPLVKNQVIFGVPSYDYTVTITVTPEEGGMVSGVQSMYYHGQTCALTATANEGYCFYYWMENGSVVSTEANYSFPVMGNRNLTAVFGLPLNVTVTANPEEGGTVEGTGTYDYGATATVTATAMGDYTFINWTENGSIVSTSSTYSFTVTANRNLVANFSLPLYITVTANPAEGGTVSGAGLYDYGSSATITATANEGYVFSRWTLNGTVVSGLSTYTFTVTSEAEYVAEFMLVSNGVAIGDAAMSSYYLPSYSAYNYTLSQQIYTADEIGRPCEITSISFFNAGTQKTRSYTIYLTHTDKSAFDSSNDWISVTEDDEVFTGNVTMVRNNWTKITLDTPFSYDGTSNLALVVDDNSGNWSSSMACRVFDAAGTQAIRVYSDGTNYDPLNPSGYSGTLMSLKNQVILRWPYTITATANPTEGGTVSGVGSYESGTTCTLTATPNTGYSFLNWTENGMVVSYDANYSFTVNGDRNLVANFVEGTSVCEIYFDLYDSYGDGWNGNYLVIDYGDGNSEQLTLTSGSSASYAREVETGCTLTLTWIAGSWIGECSFDIRFANGVPIYHGSGLSSSFNKVLEINCAVANAPRTITAIADPLEGGTVVGAGTYESGTVITLVATPNEGYTFMYWKENGVVVSSEANYSFMVTADRDLVAHFALPFTITATSDPVEGGTVEGAGVFDYGTTCTLTATANEGYTFMYWTKNGSVISYETTYSFTVTSDLTMVAHFALPFTITATSDPVEGGSVDGAGSFDYGTTCTLTATANEGYSFIYWTQNGQQVSTSATYSFTVTSDRDLVAHFSLPFTISVTSNIEAGGTFTGAGTYDYGTTCTLTASPNEGYLFLNWSKNGEVVGCNASYSFTVTEDAEIVAVFMLLEGKLIGSGESTNSYLPSYSYFCYTLSQQIYTPDEIGGAGTINSIAYYNAGGTKTRSYVIYMVATDKTTFESNTDWITVSESDIVYSGSVTMTKGYWNTIVLDTPFEYDGNSNLAIVFDDNTGSWSGNTMTCRVFNANGNQAIRVYSDGTNYNPYDPSGYTGTLYSVKNQIILDITLSSAQQSSILSQGWNWWSSYIELSGIDGLSLLEESLGENGVSIKSQNAFVDYGGQYGWTGTLQAIDNESGYKINVLEECTSLLSGVAAQPSDHPITLNAGWNLIGYPVSEAQSIVSALSNFEALQGDIIKGQEGFVTYEATLGWTPSTFTLTPGKSYMYYSNATEGKTLIYAQSRGEAMPVEQENCYWQANRHAYADNLSLMATVEVEGVEQRDATLELGVFVNGECRGSAKLYHVASIDRYIAFLTVTGKDGEQIEFRLIDESKATGTSNDHIIFHSNAIMGSLDNPVPIHFGAMNNVAELQTNMSVYPNPVDRNAPFTLAIPEEETVAEVLVVNTLGEVTTHTMGQLSHFTMLGIPVSGVYMVKVTCKSGNVYISRVVVK